MERQGAGGEEAQGVADQKKQKKNIHFIYQVGF
jgi:hypothetical protein